MCGECTLELKSGTNPSVFIFSFFLFSRSKTWSDGPSVGLKAHLWSGLLFSHFEVLWMGSLRWPNIQSSHLTDTFLELRLTFHEKEDSRNLREPRRHQSTQLDVTLKDIFSSCFPPQHITELHCQGHSLFGPVSPWCRCSSAVINSFDVMCEESRTDILLCSYFLPLFSPLAFHLCRHGPSSTASLFFSPCLGVVF